eukprot:TRINITY_DN5198_c0_g1_i1.p1 TRINITY_DN5198_c0_g1~~TRINITY_DN5198_c0_g1_i1.p1  ORF type:complete len:474 (+),score=98.20 TRINITY_DN5198_c0_g1_i1:204-1625(+)
MPPEFPQKPSEIWYNLLRPEYVMKYHKSLCSDAFSQWLYRDTNQEQFNAEARTATVHLHTRVIPEFAKHLDTNPQIKTLPVLICEAHQRGINIRHMGRVRQQLTNPIVKQLVLTECVARTLKNLIRGLLREKRKKLRISIEEPYRTEVYNFLKPIFHCYQDHPTSLVNEKNSPVAVNGTFAENLLSCPERHLYTNYSCGQCYHCHRTCVNCLNCSGTETYICPRCAEKTSDNIVMGNKFVEYLPSKCNCFEFHVFPTTPNLAFGLMVGKTEDDSKNYGFLVDLNGRFCTVPTKGFPERGKKSDFPFTIKGDDTVGIIWNSYSAFVIVQNSVIAKIPIRHVGYVKPIFKIGFFTKIEVNFGDKPFVTDFKKIMKENEIEVVEEELYKSSLTFWTKTIKTEIEERYPSCLLEEERNENFNLLQNVNMPLVIQRFQISSGIKLSSFVQDSWQEKKLFYMTSSDVQGLNSKFAFINT